MHISLEISLYPLNSDFIPAIDAFLEELHAVPELKVTTNPMSTQVYGEMNVVFPTVQKLITQTFEKEKHCSVVMKVLSADVSENEIPRY